MHNYKREKSLVGSEFDKAHQNSDYSHDEGRF